MRLDQWFTDTLSGLKCHEDTRAYIVGVLAQPLHDMSDESVVLAYRDATLIGNFVSFQRIGDWALWASAFVPRQEESQQQLIEGFGRMSYYSCHRILREQWRVYGELANDFASIVRDVRCNVARARGTLAT